MKVTVQKLNKFLFTKSRKILLIPEKTPTVTVKIWLPWQHKKLGEH